VGGDSKRESSELYQYRCYRLSEQASERVSTSMHACTIEGRSAT
jgi:hypothetical protein